VWGVTDLLNQLEMRRAQLIHEFEQDLAAIDRLISMERGGSNQGKTEPAPLRPAGNLRPHRWKPQSLTGKILSLVNESPARLWTSNELYRALRDGKAKKGEYQLPEDDLQGRNAVSSAIGELWRRGRIYRVKPSNGTIPAVYRAKEIVIDPNGKEE
jgi:hypothetical protein